jgi:hypothetical protein
MRNHVGKHVLFAIRNIDENVSLRPGAKVGILYLCLKICCRNILQVGVDPCGFCGLDGCVVQLTKKGNSNAILCSCKYHYKGMTYGMAVKCTKSAPCTNVPIHCPLCPASLSGHPRTIWKYNVMFHLAEYHADWGSDDPTLPRILGQLLVDSFITSEEESLMGIDETLTDDGREENNIPDTDGI